METLATADPVEFGLATTEWLLEREAENNLVIGVAAGLSSDAHARFFVVSETTPKLAAVWTPPRDMLVSRAEPHVARAFAETIHARHADLAGVFSEAETARVFATRWSELSGAPTGRENPQLGYALSAITPFERARGRLCRATRADRELVAAWFLAFTTELAMPAVAPDDALADADRRIASAMLHFWDADRAVAMASLTRPTRGGTAIAYVYTPPAERGKGYAKACVAALAEGEVARGRACFLNAERHNPVSNHVYASIGFVPVVDFLSIALSPDEARP